MTRAGMPPWPGRIVTAVIDSGVALGHPALRDLLEPGFDVPFGERPGDGSAHGGDGHGTRMAALIASVAKQCGAKATGAGCDARIMPIRFTKNGVSTDGCAALAIDEAVRRGVAIINLSWSSDNELPFVHQALRRAEKADVVVVVAAGNDGRDIDNGAPAFPAAYARTLANVITVMGHGPDGRRPASSNWGRKTVDLAAPASTLGVQNHDHDGCLSTVGSSTSVAAAYVSGVAALLKSASPGCSAGALKARILLAARAEPALETENRAGGRLDLRFISAREFPGLFLRAALQ